eukprot:snap_masked-scaffold_44-processed-gene-0.26-mRNA-1 protein AED:1.00 eAED:1.00 QI:0/0/0/0/1/1/3/0/67
MFLLLHYKKLLFHPAKQFDEENISDRGTVSCPSITFIALKKYICLIVTVPWKYQVYLKMKLGLSTRI